MPEDKLGANVPLRKLDFKMEAERLKGNKIVRMRETVMELPGTNHDRLLSRGFGTQAMCVAVPKSSQLLCLDTDIKG